MSAYLVSAEHLHYLAIAACQPGKNHRDPLTYYAAPDGMGYTRCSFGASHFENDDMMGADDIVMMLYQENVKSIERRYPETTGRRDLMPGPVDPAIAPCPTMSGRALAIVTLSALVCYEYQACEHDGWATSEAKRFCEALRGQAIRELDGFDHAPWAIDDAPNVVNARFEAAVAS